MSEWVSVEDYLPGHSNIVWVAVNGTDGRRFTTIGECHFGAFLMLQTADELAWSDASFESYGMTVTHWADIQMPVPP